MRDSVSVIDPIIVGGLLWHPQPIAGGVAFVAHQEMSRGQLAAARWEYIGPTENLSASRVRGELQYEAGQFAKWLEKNDPPTPGLECHHGFTPVVAGNEVLGYLPSVYPAMDIVRLHVPAPHTLDFSPYRPAPAFETVDLPFVLLRHKKGTLVKCLDASDANRAHIQAILDHANGRAA